MSKIKKKDAIDTVLSNGNILFRPFQFQYKVVVQVEKGGKIVDMAHAQDVLLEGSFAGVKVEDLVRGAKEALEKKYLSNGSSG